jgi:hypothetical protein
LNMYIDGVLSRGIRKDRNFGYSMPSLFHTVFICFTKNHRDSTLGIIVSSAKWNLPLEAAKEKALQRCPGLIPDTMEECKQEFYTLQREIKALERDAVNLRCAEQEQAIQERMIRGERAGAKALRNIKIAEESREMWRQLGTLKSKTDQGVSSIQVPANGDYSNQSCKDCPQCTP